MFFFHHLKIPLLQTSISLMPQYGHITEIRVKCLFFFFFFYAFLTLIFKLNLILKSHLYVRNRQVFCLEVNFHKSCKIWVWTENASLAVTQSKLVWNGKIVPCLLINSKFRPVCNKGVLSFEMSYWEMTAILAGFHLKLELFFCWCQPHADSSRCLWKLLRETQLLCQSSLCCMKQLKAMLCC